ncbi:MAG: hypothetical protein IJ809_02365 [Clostridia bacterium]|nr:hypothetical protein [Clostridia bacterium]
MKFTLTCKELEHFKILFEAVVGYFLGLFQDTKLMQSKMLFTEVIISLVNTDTHSEIECRQDGYVISIDINPLDSDESVLHQFAHELCHLLLMPLMLNPCIITGYSKVDESYAITTLTRRAGRVTYGISFEEAFCNWLALKAVNATLKKDFRNAKFISKDEIALVDTIVNCFEIATSAKWDSLTKDRLPTNALLFGIAYGDISYAISCMDSIMGKGTWKDLMHSAYEYMSAENENKKEASWKIKLCAKAFKKEFKYTLKTREVLTA